MSTTRRTLVFRGAVVYKKFNETFFSRTGIVLTGSIHMAAWQHVGPRSKLKAKWRRLSTTDVPLMLNQRISERFVAQVREKLRTSELFGVVTDKLLSLLSDEITSTAAAAAVSSCNMSLCCYGLGGGCETFVVQVCFAALLREALNIPTDMTWVSDPLMQTGDISIVEMLGLIPDNFMLPQQAENTTPVDYLATVKKFFVSISKKISLALSSSDCRPLDHIILLMPHCDKPIYGEILRCISTLLVSSRTKIWIIGNDLRQYDKFQAAKFYQNNTDASAAYVVACNYLDSVLPQVGVDFVLPACSLFPRAFSEQVVCHIEGLAPVALSLA